MQANQINLAIHIGMGVAGLVCGLWPLLSAKGGRLHRKSGRVFVVLAGVVLGTALLADIFLKQPIALLTVSLAACYEYAAGLRSLALRNRGPTMIDALLASAALAGCIWLVRSMGEGPASWSPVIVYSTAGYVACIALYDLSRPLWVAYWLRYVRPLDHGLKMTACYFAMLSSGAGNSLRNLQPWSQLIPSSLGIVVMAVILVSYLSRRIALASAI
jgi:uncharacterized membrane protein